jgi:hypothetical protein
LEHHFSLGKFRRHEQKGLVVKHFDLVSIAWPYSHKKWEDELFLQDYDNWEEVLERKKNPHLTIFRVISIDEQLVEIQMGVDAKRDRKEYQESQSLEEIKLKEETELKVRHDEQLRV